MIPAYLITLDLPAQLQRQDRQGRAAAAAGRHASGRPTRRATLIETLVADLYATLLGRDQVGATDSFFDLGGNSLQAMRLITMLDSELDVDLDVAAVFLAPTARQLAALLRDEHGSRTSAELTASTTWTGWRRVPPSTRPAADSPRGRDER